MSKSAQEMVCYLLDHMSKKDISNSIGVTSQRVGQIAKSQDAVIGSASFLSLLALYQRIERTVKRQAK
jgi:hypothetical protein